MGKEAAQVTHLLFCKENCFIKRITRLRKEARRRFTIGWIFEILESQLVCMHTLILEEEIAFCLSINLFTFNFLETEIFLPFSRIGLLKQVTQYLLVCKLKFDEIEEKAGCAWMRRAQDRKAWRKLWRPSASSGVTG